MAELLEAEKVEEKSPRIAKKVLFVQNVPYDTTDEEFEKAFSDVGPIRKCFLIREKGLFVCPRGQDGFMLHVVQLLSCGSSVMYFVIFLLASYCVCRSQNKYIPHHHSKK